MSVKLPFDQNLSPKLVERLADLYPNSNHLDLLGLGTADDVLVWKHAKNNDFVIVTKDADFADMSICAVFRRKSCGFDAETARQTILRIFCVTIKKILGN